MCVQWRQLEVRRGSGAGVRWNAQRSSGKVPFHFSGNGNLGGKQTDLKSQGERNKGGLHWKAHGRLFILHSKRELRFLVHFRKMPLQICDHLLHIDLALQFPPALRL